MRGTGVVEEEEEREEKRRRNGPLKKARTVLWSPVWNFPVSLSSISFILPSILTAIRLLDK